MTETVASMDDFTRDADALRQELRDQFEQPALAMRAKLEAKRDEIQAAIDSINEQLRMVNAMLRPFSVETKRPRGQTASTRKEQDARRTQQVRDYINAHADELSAGFTGNTLHKTLLANGGGIGIKTVRDVVSDLHAQGFLVAVRTTTGGGVVYRPTSTAAGGTNRNGGT